MSKKPVVGLIYGGRSVEHDISIKSATNIFQNIDRNAYEVTLIGIDQNGGWYLNQEPIADIENGQPLTLSLDSHKFHFLKTGGGKINIDVAFPILHGTDGEDGSVQGLFKTAKIPVVGSGVLGSANAMNKIVAKRLLKEAGVPVANYQTYDYRNRADIQFSLLKNRLGLPFIVKPASLGSSVGISKVNGEADLKEAVDTCFQYDEEMIIEEFIEAREFECAIMGNDDPKATVPGEIVIGGDYELYSFDAKYVDPSGASITIPADLDPETTGKVRSLCIKSYKALHCEDYARVDFFFTTHNRIVINEINTIPGFTDISMFPKLWEYEGVEYTVLISKLIEFARDRFRRKAHLVTHFVSNLQ